VTFWRGCGVKYCVESTANTIGGYQVIKKWLSYREKELLGRGLTPEEVRYVTEMARRLAALVALQPCLNENYSRVVEATCSWPSK